MIGNVFSSLLTKIHCSKSKTAILASMDIEGFMYFLKSSKTLTNIYFSLYMIIFKLSK